MKIIITPTGEEIKIFSSAKELSIERYTELQKYLALEASQGSSVDSLSLRLQRVKAFIQEGGYDAAKIEIDNALLSLNNVLKGVDYYSPAFAILVSEIGGKVEQDISPDGLHRMADRLKAMNISFGTVQDEVNYVKKKIDDELEVLFPEGSALISIFCNMVDYIATVASTDFEDDWQVEQLTHKSNWFLTKDEPSILNIADIDKNFYSICSLMEEKYGSSNPQKYSVMQFYYKLNAINTAVNERRD